MRAATVVQVLQDLFYVLLHVLFICDRSFNVACRGLGESRTCCRSATTLMVHHRKTTALTSDDLPQARACLESRRWLPAASCMMYYFGRPGRIPAATHMRRAHRASSCQQLSA